MKTRLAENKDIPKILDLLVQVNKVHSDARPDLFKTNTKYNAKELEEIIADENKPIIVCVDDEDIVLGYGFCDFSEYKNHNLTQDMVTCYIDDICVDENARRRHVGKTVYDAIVDLAKERNCHNITLNVWELNKPAYEFYKNLGMKIQKTTMETVLD